MSKAVIRDQRGRVSEDPIQVTYTFTQSNTNSYTDTFSHSRHKHSKHTKHSEHTKDTQSRHRHINPFSLDLQASFSPRSPLALCPFSLSSCADQGLTSPLSLVLFRLVGVVCAAAAVVPGSCPRAAPGGLPPRCRPHLRRLPLLRRYTLYNLCICMYHLIVIKAK